MAFVYEAGEVLVNESTAARRRIVVVASNSSGAPITGLTFTGSDLQISKNGAAFANFAGSVVEIGNGMYYYEFTAGEIDTLGVALIYAKSGGSMQDVYAGVPIVATDPFEDVWERDLEGALSAKEFMRIMGAALAGELSGAATTTIVIKSMESDAKTRITATVDAQGNRDTVVIDGSD